MVPEALSLKCGLSPWLGSSMRKYPARVTTRMVGFFFLLAVYFGLRTKWFGCSSDQLREAGRVKLKLERMRPLFITMRRRVHITRNRWPRVLYALLSLDGLGRAGMELPGDPVIPFQNRSCKKAFS